MARIAMVLARSLAGPETGRKRVIRSAIDALTAQGHAVDLLVLARADAAMQHEGKVVWLGTPGKARILLNAARAALGGGCLNEALFRSRRLLAGMHALKGTYDFAFADTIRAAPYASALGVPWHLDMDDLFSLRYERFAEAGELSADLVLGYYRDSMPRVARALSGTLMREILRREAVRIRRRELYWARRATTVSLVSADEARRFARDAGRPVHSLPMSVSMAPARWTPPGTPAQPVFVGGLDYKPNLDALLYYQREIHPKLRGRARAPVLHHIGNAPERLRRLFDAQVVRFEGYVADLAARLREAAFFMAPILSGTGIKTKVLEAMASGVPVVSTREGISGLQVEHRRHCLVCEHAADFPVALRAVAEPSLALQLSTQGARYVEENFSPAVLRRRWEALLTGIMR